MGEKKKNNYSFFENLIQGFCDLRVQRESRVSPVYFTSEARAIKNVNTQLSREARMIAHFCETKS